MVISWQLPDPVQLMQKSRDLTMMTSLKSTMTLTIYEKNGSTRERTINLLSRKYGEAEKRMIKFVEPADVRGTALLIIDNDKGPDDMWIYLPALKRTRRIVSTEKGKSFMSSEFSNADMSSAPLSDFKIALLPASGENGLWVIESKTLSQDKADEYGYSRKITYIDKNDFKIKKIEFFNDKDVKSRTIEVLATQPIGSNGEYLMTELYVKNFLNGRSSRIKYNDVNATAEVPDNTFTVENMER
jgi:hypothetical protein